MNAKVGDEARVVCECCEEERDCTFTASPYAYEIAGDDTPGWYCDQCLYSLARDI